MTLFCGKDEKTDMKSVTIEDFASYWGVDSSSLPNSIEEYLGVVNTKHRETDKEELEEYVNSFVKKVSKSTSMRTKEENIAIFEKGWSEHKEHLKEKCDFDALMPKYYGGGLPFFLGPDLSAHVCENNILSAEMQILYMRYLASTYFRPFDEIHEFGSGSGLNLFAIGSTTPDKRLIGYEWTKSGTEIADLIGEKSGLQVTGRRFDMLQPDRSVDLEGKAILTVASIEQLGENYSAFLEFLMAAKPGIVAHLEPGAPSASSKAMYSNLAVLYAKLRGYPLRFSETLKALDAENKISILFSRPLPWVSRFGNYTCTIWKPY